jgi:cobalt-zinc-cadmium efflux system outer membrane protein
VKGLKHYMAISALVLAPAGVSGQTLQPAPPSLERLTLEAAVDEALTRNLDLTAKRLGVTIADANLVTAALRPNPVLSLGGDHLDWLGTGYNAINNAGPQEYSARVEFLFERGDRRGRRVEVAQDERQIALADLRDAIRSLTLDVRQAFVDLQLARENLALARQNAASLNEIVSLNQTRVRSGDLAEVELLRSRIAALQSEQAVRAAELKVRSESRRLERVLGRPPGAGLLDVQELEPQARITEALADLQTHARRVRPDLRSAELTQARSQAEIRRQLAVGAVDWTFGAEYRRQDGLAGRGNSLGLFMSTPLPLFDRNQGNTARARDEGRQTDLRLLQLQRSVDTEVDLAAAQYASAQATLQTVESDMLTQARDVRNITDYAYRRGEATLIEFLDAQRAFNETMQAWNEARAEYARSAYLVRAAVGEDAIR